MPVFFTLNFEIMKKQTAVEWLVEKLQNNEDISIESPYINSLIRLAKAMEKEQMKDAVLDDVLTENMKRKFAERFEQYYNEIYL